jgi:hypothetical protein
MYQQPQYPPPQPGYYGPQYSGCVKILLYGLSFFMPLVGLIAGIIFMSRPDPESKRLGQTCLIVGLLGFALWCCLGVGGGVIVPLLMEEYY